MQFEALSDERCGWRTREGGSHLDITGANTIEDMSYFGFDDPVVDSLPLPPRGYDPVPAQSSQMLRDDSLRQGHLLPDLTHRGITVFEDFHDLEAVPMAKHPDRIGYADERPRIDATDQLISVFLFHYTYSNSYITICQ